jgi:hypothetical protein
VRAFSDLCWPLFKQSIPLYLPMEALHKMDLGKVGIAIVFNILGHSSFDNIFPYVVNTLSKGCWFSSGFPPNYTGHPAWHPIPYVSLWPLLQVAWQPWIVETNPFNCGIDIDHDRQGRVFHHRENPTGNRNRSQLES